MEKTKEMKTLKDVEQYSNARRHYAKSHLLKEVAIEWIKAVDENPHYCTDRRFNCMCGKTRNLRKWIKHFFNLSEDDLKDGKD